jgi:hypothetical protein
MARYGCSTFLLLLSCASALNETLSDDDYTSSTEVEGGLNIVVALCVGGAIIVFLLGKKAVQVISSRYSTDGVSAAQKSIGLGMGVGVAKEGVGAQSTRITTSATIESSVAELRETRMVLEQKDDSKRMVLHV